MKQRQAVAKVTAKRYRQAGRSEKKQMLDEFCRTTGYNRCYARWVLRHQGQRLSVGDGLVLEAEVQPRRQRIKPRTYDQKVQRALVQIWELLDYVCGKRLVAILPEMIVKLEEFDELHLDEEIRAKLMRVSAATADRLLEPERRKHELKGRGHTRAGTLLKHQIPIRTFAEWDEGKPGFVEMDLVAHDGGLAIGDYAQSLDMTDICTGWTETIAVPNKPRCGSLKRSGRLVVGCHFPCWGSTQTTARSSSIMNCGGIASRKVSASPALDLIGRMTTVMSNRRTIRWYGAKLAINDLTRRQRVCCSISSMIS